MPIGYLTNKQILSLRTGDFPYPVLNGHALGTEFNDKSNVSLGPDSVLVVFAMLIPRFC
jgi:hypothetical protein